MVTSILKLLFLWSVVVILGILWPLVGHIELWGLEADRGLAGGAEQSSDGGAAGGAPAGAPGVEGEMAAIVVTSYPKCLSRKTDLEPARADLTAAEILGWRLLTTEVTMAPWPAPLREKEFWPKLDTEGPKLWGAGRV